MISRQKFRSPNWVENYHVFYMNCALCNKLHPQKSPKRSCSDGREISDLENCYDSKSK